MTVSKSMEEIWAIKDQIGRELEGKSNEEILAYFRDHEPEWSKTLPHFKGAESPRTPSKREES